MYKVCVYIPESSLERVKQAMFAAGAGEFGHYDSCAWQVAGDGQIAGLRTGTAKVAAQAAGKRAVISVFVQAAPGFR